MILDRVAAKRDEGGGGPWETTQEPCIFVRFTLVMNCVMLQWNCVCVCYLCCLCSVDIEYSAEARDGTRAQKPGTCPWAPVEDGAA